jgi:DNA-directed RNA polymerase specialized sigma subunit
MKNRKLEHYWETVLEGKHRQVLEAQRAEQAAIELAYKDGISLTLIGKALGVKRWTISRRLQK